MLGKAWTAALTVALIAAGCIGATPDETLDPASKAGEGVLATGPLTEDVLSERSLEAPPVWHKGEWWTFEVDAALTGQSYEATIVVAGERDGQLLLGMPEESFSDLAMVTHFPPAGPMGMEDLSWYFHSDPFTMAPFPLEPGKTWSFDWVGAKAEAEVVAVDAEAGIAEIDVLQPNAHLMLTYDAELGFVSKMTWEGLATYEIVDHGAGYEGTVIVPDDPTLAIFEGRLAGVADTNAIPQPGPPVLEVEVAEGRDTMSLGFILGELIAEQGTGVYRAGATAPDGATYEGVLLPTDGAPAVLRTQHVRDPAGTWTLDFEAAGSGAAVVEAVAYDAIEIELPAQAGSSP